VICWPNAKSLHSGVRMASLEDSFESVTHSFIVRIWLEQDDEVRWRGHITHVPGEERRYVERLSDITDFIAPYVEGMQHDRGGRFRKWWAARRSKRKKNGGHGG
jgi:hypothetical protein